MEKRDHDANTGLVSAAQGTQDEPGLAARLEAVFRITLLGTLAVRLLLAIVIPFTGDEAYFYHWALYPSWGYYDHPPMIGWLLTLLGYASDSPAVLRLATILVPTIGACLVRALARPAGPVRANLAAIGFALLPAQVLFALVTTDTPLILFSMLSLAVYALALDRNSLRLHAAAGLFLGLAFTSKYFAALQVMAYVVFTALSPRAERRWPGLAVTLAAALPFLILNLAWNYSHAWANIMFNVFNRHDKDSLNAHTWLIYLAELAYVLGPIALWQLARNRDWLKRLRAEPRLRLMTVTVGFPLAIFAALSPWKTIGLHWLLSFIAPFFVITALVLPPATLRLSARFLGYLSGAHLLIATVVLALPLESFRNRASTYRSVIMTVRCDELLKQLAPWEGHYEFATEGYSPAVTMSYNALRAGFVASPSAPPEHRADRSRFFVYGRGSSHARHDDILTDFRRLAGRDIAVLAKTPHNHENYDPFFESVSYEKIVIRGATYHIALGRRFRYEAYRDTMLTFIHDRYYRIPRHLPLQRCYFCERYFNRPVCADRTKQSHD